MPTLKPNPLVRFPACAMAVGLFTVLAATSPVGAQGADSVWTVGETGLQIQNVDPSGAAEIRARFFDFDGRLTHDLPRNVLPGAATNFYLPEIERNAGLVPQSYALIVTANRPVVAVSRTEDRRTGAALLYGNVPPATEMAVPLVTKAFANQNSLVSIQNTSTSSPARLVADIFRSGVTEPVKRLDRTLPPAGSGLVDFWRDHDLADIPDGFVGWMRIVGDVPVTVQASVHQAQSAQAVAAFEGLPLDAASARLYVPLFRSGWYGTTGIAVVNPSTTEGATLTATFRGSQGTCVGRSYVQGPVQLAPAAGAVFFQGPGDVPLTGASPLPDGCAGTAVIESVGGGILGMVMELDSVARPHTATATHAATARHAARHLAAPLIRHRHTAADLVTGIQVMNVDPSRPATVRLQVIDSEGRPIPGGPDRVATVAPLQGWTWYLPSLSGLRERPGLYGSALIDSDRDVTAVVVESSLNGRSDSATYNAIAVDGQETGSAGPVPLDLLIHGPASALNRKVQP